MLMKIFALFLSALLCLNSLLPIPLKFIEDGINDYLEEDYTYRETSPSGLSIPAEKNRDIIEKADFYVSPSGNDENDGSFSAPFATVEKARDEVRKLDRSGRDGITVAVMAGEYRVSSLTFTYEDSGTEGCPVKYCAYGDGEVVLNGGLTLTPDGFRKVTDEEILSRLNKNAAKNVVAFDLKAAGVSPEEYGKIYAIGSYNTASYYGADKTGDIYCELFVNDRRQTLARYPNEGWLKTGEPVSSGLGHEGDPALPVSGNVGESQVPPGDVYKIDGSLAKRINSWKSLDDVWLFGYWKYDWADASTPLGGFDYKEKTISTEYFSGYGTKEDAPYYFFNVLEELDSPGEWYLDRENGVIYLYPAEELSQAQTDLSLTVSPVIRGENADHLTFDGFTVKGSRGNGIQITGNNCTVTDCVIKNVSGSAVIMNGSGNTVSDCEITRTGKGGIYITGGSREELIPGESKAVNNLIHDWSEVYLTYQPAVTLNGFGNLCAHNEIFNSPHEAITYSGNDHIIEYNLIHDVCLLSDDAGAIYTGRHWDYYGNIIRYNCIYNVGSQGHRPDGIYMDDALSGQTVYGNLLVNVPKIGIHLGGGRDLTVKNNIIINSNDRSFSYDSRAIDGVFGGWFSISLPGGSIWEWLYSSPWQTEKWKEAYPQTAKLKDDFNNTDDPYFAPNPAFSDVSGNVVVNLTGSAGFFSEAAQKYSTIENNPVYRIKDLSKIFNDPAKGDYSLTENSPVRTDIPGFEELPLSEIGRQ